MRRKISESFLGFCQDGVMKSVEREKMCISCEGRIPIDAEVCHYCASKQSGAGLQNSFQAPIFQHQSLEDSLTSLYTPPYQGKRPQFSINPNTESAPSYSYDEEEASPYKSVKPERETIFKASVDEEEKAASKNSLWPTAFLLGGAHFSILGLMQLFFSKNGILRLEWDANYWFFYCLIGIPLLYFGYKKLKTVG